jgi:hypothetical protein
MPLSSPDSSSSSETLVGSFKSKADTQMSKMLYEQDVMHDLDFVDIVYAEFIYSIKILRHYTSMASVLEICKHVQSSDLSSRLMHDAFRDIYIDDIANGLYDLRAMGASLGGAGPLMYLVNGTIKSIEGYIKHIIDEIRSMLKKRDLKASRTKVAIAWTLDPNEMRGDKIELLSLLETKLKDYIGDVEPQEGTNFDLYPTDKTMIVIACTKNDSMRILSKNKQTMDFILMKANPVCETIG